MEEIIAQSSFYMVMSLLAGILVFVMLSRAASRHEKIPGRYQAFFEVVLDGLRNTFLGALGSGNEKHLPFIMTLFFYILIGNFLEFVPALKAPTSCSSIPIALGIMWFFYIQYVGIKSHGVVGYFKHFCGPIIWLAPMFFFIEVIGELAKPFSLGMRLFGNLFGEDQILNQVYLAMGNNVIAHIIPIELVPYILQIFTDLIQAFVFPMLVASFIASMSASHEEHSDGDSAHQSSVSA